MVSHRVEQNIRKIGGQMILREGLRRMGGKRPVRLRSPLADLPNSNVAGRQRSYSADRGPGRGNMPELKKRAKARGVKLAGHEAGGKKRFEFRGEYELAGGLVQVKRFDAQTVAPENQFALASVPNCNGKHAAQFFDETLAIFQVEMKDNLRVRSGAEGMAALFEFGAQFAGVIAFPVVGNPGLAIRAGHGHTPAVAQINDGEARIGQKTCCEFLNTLAIRAAVFHGSGHAVRSWAQRIV